MRRTLLDWRICEIYDERDAHVDVGVGQIREIRWKERFATFIMMELVPVDYHRARQKLVAMHHNC